MERDTVTIPVLALRGINLFPKMMMHFDVKRVKSIASLDEAMKHEQKIFLVAQKKAHIEEPDPKMDLFMDGMIAKIKQMVKLPNNTVRVLVEGEKRAQLIEIIENETYLVGQVEVFDEDDSFIDPIEKEALLSAAREVVDIYLQINPNFSKEAIKTVHEADGVGALADAIAFHLVIALENKQSILANYDPISRLKLAIRIVHAEIEITKLKNDINHQVKLKIDQNQKEYFLREQMKVIQSELGENQEVTEEAQEYEAKAQKMNAPKEVKEKLLKEIKRFKKISPASSEGTVSRNYIETLLEMPWRKKTKEALDIIKAQEILDHDHYGLEKVKERVIEHLAVRQLSKGTDSPILCLVGPPGTGKTSIAKSIATALNRKYARISLGGVRDEAEIRGHRKTYIGAMPGRLVNALKQAESSNPLILLDEIDKMSNDFRGDPSSALLEVLDSEQNSKFRDHYVEVPVDLSDVLFIATANDARTIPRPLLDRMELIQINSYTENEKIHIAKNYLIPKQLEKHGLTSEQLRMSDKAIDTIITYYTKEAGVRHLERRIGEICRKAAKEVLTNKRKKIQISETNVKHYLGMAVFRYDELPEEPQIGIARGLAWTSVGGDTLSIEVNVMNGKGTFEITGQIGDVMKESAKAAISYIRSRAELLNIPKEFYKEKDIHIHIPEGAVPKDGPSAGITMATAMISALTEEAVCHELAMTGEITLRGRVLPIGGIKEKLLAAKRVGIKKVLVPYDNQRDVDKISKEITSGLEIVFVKSMDEVITHALIKKEVNPCLSIK